MLLQVCTRSMLNTNGRTVARRGLARPKGEPKRLGNALNEKSEREMHRAREITSESRPRAVAATEARALAGSSPPLRAGCQEPHSGGAIRTVRRKKLLGGTSWLTRFTPRGSPADYDGWETLGNPGWSLED